MHLQGEEMPRKRKKVEEEHENMERWLVSYADFITLLFAFFVTMYAISRVDEQKLGSAVESLQRALGSLIPVQVSQRSAGAFPSGPDQVPIRILAGAEPAQEIGQQESSERLAEEIQRQLAGLSGGGGTKNSAPTQQIKFIIEKRGLVIRVPECFFFASGDASIKPEVFPVLNALAKSLEKIPNHIRIEGHTDSVPINTPLFPSNWELSTTRATTLIRYLLANYRFHPGRISATGYAEFHPIAPNGTAEGRMQNRRVDVVVLNSKEEKTEPSEKRTSNPPPYQFPRTGKSEK